MTAIGLLGGTFNPVHIGHLRLAIECYERLGLHEVLLLPASQPPLKDRPTISAAHREAMLRLAVASVPALRVDGRELNRDGLSYTVDTLAELRAERGSAASLVFILGMDSLANLHRWHRWHELFQLANLAVTARPGSEPVMDPAVADVVARCQCKPDQLTARPAGGLAFIGQPPLAVSSTAVRAALSSGKNVHFLLPDPVIEYISQHELYDIPQTAHRGGQ